LLQRASLLFLSSLIVPSASLGASLVERLGFSPNDRVLIINCDDFGMCHAHNLATFDALTRGVATSATVMMPCPWVAEVVQWKKTHPDADVGIHLTLTAEWDNYNWRPVLGLSVPSLVDPDGNMWDDNLSFWQHADPEEVYRECRAQVELAIRLGLDPTHLDNHMGSLQLNPNLATIYARLGAEFNLPVRLASEKLYAAFGAVGHRKVYEDLGVLGPDVLVYPGEFACTEPKAPEEARAYYECILRALRPGTVTELYLHPALDGPELRSVTGSYLRRQADYDWLVADRTRALIDELGIKLVGYRAIRDLQRQTTHP